MKYPRTPHLPSSPGATSDDKRLANDVFIGQPVVVTEKLDGENTSILKNGLHARSEQGTSHPWQSYVRSLHGQISYLMPDWMQIVGENLFAIHSIEYKNLPSSFFVIGCIDLRDDTFLSFEETQTVASDFGLQMIPVLYKGIWDGKFQIPKESIFGGLCEGYVVRNPNSFEVQAFGDNVAKWVREGHVQTDSHWRSNWKPAKVNKTTT